jgi:cobalt-zinc-cadmium efflux system protein
MGHGHHHHGAGGHGARENRRRLSRVLGLVSLYLVVEVAGGILTGSLALLADAGHMLTDVVGIGLALVAMKVSERLPTPERTYGYHRFEILAALANAVVLIAVSVYILYEAWERFRDPPAVSSGVMLAVAVGGLAVNLASVFILKAGSGDSLNIKGAYFEVLSDLLSSAGVIAAAAVMWATGWYWADPLVSGAIGLFILPRTWALLNEAVGVLLEGTPPGIELSVLRRAMEDVPGVTSIHDLHVWTITSGMNVLTAHAVIDDGVPHEPVLEGLRRCVTSGFGVGHVTVQVERPHCGDSEAHG